MQKSQSWPLLSQQAFGDQLESRLAAVKATNSKSRAWQLRERSKVMTADTDEETHQSVRQDAEVTQCGGDSDWKTQKYNKKMDQRTKSHHETRNQTEKYNETRN